MSDWKRCEVFRVFYGPTVNFPKALLRQEARCQRNAGHPGDHADEEMAWPSGKDHHLFGPTPIYSLRQEGDLRIEEQSGRLGALIGACSRRVRRVAAALGYRP